MPRYEMSAYLPDDASWPAICHMLNTLLLESRLESKRLSNEVERLERRVETYRRLIADFFPLAAKVEVKAHDDDASQTLRESPRL